MQAIAISSIWFKLNFKNDQNITAVKCQAEHQEDICKGSDPLLVKFIDGEILIVKVLGKLVSGKVHMEVCLGAGLSLEISERMIVSAHKILGVTNKIIA